MSARQYDQNHFFTVNANPITKAGIFRYSGKQIMSKKNPPSMALDPNKIYNVLRPAEELAAPECIESFKLLPFIDGHAMLGEENKGHTPAEKKGIHGVIGETVYFEEPYLLAKLKVFSEKMGADIDKGKKEVSAGYRCRYEITSGIWNGQQYDAIQRQIRGNHVALVPDGRCGSDVSVLDEESFDHFTVTFDAMELTMEMTLDEALKENADLKAQLQTAMDEKAEAEKKAMDAEEKMKKDAMDAEEKAKKEAEDKAVKDAAEKAAKEDKGDKAMDAAEIKRTVDETVKTRLADATAAQTLAKRLTAHVGVFDAAEMTKAEVAAYGVQKLGISSVSGQEAAALEGYFHAQAAKASGGTVTMDSKGTGTEKPSKLRERINASK